MTVVAALICLALPSSLGQVSAIALGGMTGVLVLPRVAPALRTADALPVGIPIPIAATLLVLFFGLLVGLPWLAQLGDSHLLSLINAFYMAGSLVFGGGHVVLPLLQGAVVAPGWVSRTYSWPATAQHRQCPGRSLRSPPFWAP